MEDTVFNKIVEHFISMTVLQHLNRTQNITPCFQELKTTDEFKENVHDKISRFDENNLKRVYNH